MRLEDPILSQLLPEMHQALDAMQAPVGGHDAAGPFLSRLFHLGARLHRSPSLLEHEEVQRLLARGQAPHSGAALSILAYARGLEELNAQTWEERVAGHAFSIDHWARACTERSALEFALEFVLGLIQSVGPAIAEVLARSDAHFKAKIERGATPHPEQIPPGVPLSHWWWRYEGGEATEIALAAST